MERQPHSSAKDVGEAVHFVHNAHPVHMPKNRAIARVDASGYSDEREQLLALCRAVALIDGVSSSRLTMASSSERESSLKPVSKKHRGLIFFLYSQNGWSIL